MSRRIPLILSYVFLGVVALFTLFPVYWLVASSLKPPSDFSNASPIPERLTLENYIVAFTQSPVLSWLANSAIIAVLTTALGLLVCSMAAFAFARYRFRGKTLLFAGIVGTLAIPDYVTLIPVFLIERQLGLLNTFAAVVLPLAASALTLFMLRQFFSQVPTELFEALRIDGGGEWRAYTSVALPLVRPGLGAAGLLLFLASWNAYLLPLVVLRSPSLQTMPIGLSATHSQLTQGAAAIDPWSVLSAGAVLSIIPLAIALVLFQRQFVSGLTSGAIK